MKEPSMSRFYIVLHPTQCTVHTIRNMENHVSTHSHMTITIIPLQFLGWLDRSVSRRSEFLKVTTTNTNNSLELTANHIIFRWTKIKKKHQQSFPETSFRRSEAAGTLSPVYAGNLQIGDELVRLDEGKVFKWILILYWMLGFDWSGRSREGFELKESEWGGILGATYQVSTMKSWQVVFLLKYKFDDTIKRNNLERAPCSLMGSWFPLLPPSLTTLLRWAPCFCLGDPPCLNSFLIKQFGHHFHFSVLPLQQELKFYLYSLMWKLSKPELYQWPGCLRSSQALAQDAVGLRGLPAQGRCEEGGGGFQEDRAYPGAS